MANRQFNPHGEFECSVAGRMLVLRTRGPWNRELIEQYGAHMGAMIARLYDSPWGVLATVVNEGVHTPESLAAMIEGIRTHRTRGRCATAVIFENVFGEPIVRSMLERMYRMAGEPVAFFHDAAEATDWLQEQIRMAGPNNPWQ